MIECRNVDSVTTSCWKSVGKIVPLEELDQKGEQRPPFFPNSLPMIPKTKTAVL